MRIEQYLKVNNNASKRSIVTVLAPVCGKTATLSQHWLITLAGVGNDGGRKKMTEYREQQPLAAAGKRMYESPKHSTLSYLGAWTSNLSLWWQIMQHFVTEFDPDRLKCKDCVCLGSMPIADAFLNFILKQLAIWLHADYYSLQI